MMKWSIRLLSIMSLGFMFLPSMASADPWNHGPWSGGEQKITGCVQNFSPFNLDLRRGPHVRLHNGTIIRPTGIQLHHGQRVAIVGHRDPRANWIFIADKIRVRGECPRWR